MTRSDFEFAEFIIKQEDTAMPVTTDACVFGALAKFENRKRILDIGTGTGLLSLILAQKFENVDIIAVEISEKEAALAESNFFKSKFGSRISLVVQDVKALGVTEKFDSIICNPPFFYNYLIGNSEDYNRARHQLQLTFTDIAIIANKLLTDSGEAFILVPYNHLNYLIESFGKVGFFPKSIIQHLHYAHSKAHVCSVLLTRQQGETEISNIIYKEDKNYSEEFKILMKEIYRHGFFD